MQLQKILQSHNTPNKVRKHLKENLFLSQPDSHLKSGQAGWPHSFGSFSGFRKHLNKCPECISFDSVGKGDFTLCQSILETNCHYCLYLLRLDRVYKNHSRYVNNCVKSLHGIETQPM